MSVKRKEGMSVKRKEGMPVKREEGMSVKRKEGMSVKREVWGRKMMRFQLKLVEYPGMEVKWCGGGNIWLESQ